jgi:hypothetical protein
MSKIKKEATAILNEDIIEPIFNIRKIELLNFNLKPRTDETPQEVQFEIQVKQEVSLKEKIVISIITIIIKDQNAIEVAQLTVSCIFEVDNITEIVIHNPSSVALGFKLNQVTISTARGVMFGLFRGTVLGEVVLPIVDVKEFSNSAK